MRIVDAQNPNSSMFSTKERLLKRTGEYGVGREEYLGLLVKEFHKTASKEAKEQLLANLANFAYDPINFEFLRKLKVLDIFLDHLSDESEKLQEFSIAGLCNLCADPDNRDYILHQKAIQHITPLLSSSNQEVTLNAIATLIYLITPESKADIVTSDILQKIGDLTTSNNKRIANLAQVFISDYPKTT